MLESVLVLNANFEPIHVCDLRRAVGLIYAERASLVMNGRGFIHTVRLDYPRPSVIRLNRMVHRPHPVVKLARREIFRRDNWRCQYCGRFFHNLTVDHVIPRHLGGEHVWTNLVAACPHCNHRKGGRTIDQAPMHLLRTPSMPPASATYLFAHHLHENQEWIPFVTGW